MADTRQGFGSCISHVEPLHTFVGGSNNLKTTTHITGILRICGTFLKIFIQKPYVYVHVCASNIKDLSNFSKHEPFVEHFLYRKCIGGLGPPRPSAHWVEG